MEVITSLTINAEIMTAKKNTSDKKVTGKKKQGQEVKNELTLVSLFDTKEELEINAAVEITEEKVAEYTSPKLSFDKPIYLKVNRQNLFLYFITGLISPTLY